MNNTAARNVIGRTRIKLERPKVETDTQRKQATTGKNTNRLKG